MEKINEKNNELLFEIKNEFYIYEKFLVFSFILVPMFIVYYSFDFNYNTVLNSTYHGGKAGFSFFATIGIPVFFIYGGILIYRIINPPKNLLFYKDKIIDPLPVKRVLYLNKIDECYILLFPKTEDRSNRYKDYLLLLILPISLSIFALMICATILYSIYRKKLILFPKRIILKQEDEKAGNEIDILYDALREEEKENINNYLQKNFDKSLEDIKFKLYIPQMYQKNIYLQKENKCHSL